MTGVIDQVKTWTKRKPKEVVREIVTETPPLVEDIERQEETPIFTERINIADMLFNMLNQINMNKVTGYYNFAKWEHEDQYLDDCKEFVNRMEILEPDNTFRKDIIVAGREPDEVDVGHAMLAACQRLMIRKKVGLPEKYQETEYQPDVKDIESREFEDD